MHIVDSLLELFRLNFHCNVGRWFCNLKDQWTNLMNMKIQQVNIPRLASHTMHCITLPCAKLAKIYPSHPSPDPSWRYLYGLQPAICFSSFSGTQFGCCNTVAMHIHVICLPSIEHYIQNSGDISGHRPQKIPFVIICNDRYLTPLWLWVTMVTFPLSDVTENFAFFNPFNIFNNNIWSAF